MNRHYSYFVNMLEGIIVRPYIKYVFLGKLTYSYLDSIKRIIQFLILLNVLVVVRVVAISYLGLTHRCNGAINVSYQLPIALLTPPNMLIVPTMPSYLIFKRKSNLSTSPLHGKESSRTLLIKIC